MNDAVIKYTFEVRELEKAIDFAQRIKYKGPEKNLRKELELLRTRRD